MDIAQGVLKDLDKVQDERRHRGYGSVFSAVEKANLIAAEAFISEELKLARVETDSEMRSSPKQTRARAKPRRGVWTEIGCSCLLYWYPCHLKKPFLHSATAGGKEWVRPKPESASRLALRKEEEVVKEIKGVIKSNRAEWVRKYGRYVDEQLAL